MIAKEGFPYIIGALAVILILIIFPTKFLIIISVLLLIFFVIFFRDPERNTPPFDDIAVSGADGKVVEVCKEEYDGDEYLKISVFMNIFNVHVNRAPLNATIISIEHKPGKFMSANKKESSLENEQNVITAETKYGKAVFKQVAGLVARRTVCYLNNDDQVIIGDRLGIIKFSSRFDHYFPTAFTASVSIGDTVKAGETIIARYTA